MEFDNSFEVPLHRRKRGRRADGYRADCAVHAGRQGSAEVVDKDTYKGKISVRLGPVALAFAGTVGSRRWTRPITARPSRRRNRRQRQRRRPGERRIPSRADAERLQGADPHRSHAVRGRRAVRPRRRGDPGDRQPGDHAVRNRLKAQLAQTQVPAEALRRNNRRSRRRRARSPIRAGRGRRARFPRPVVWRAAQRFVTGCGRPMANDSAPSP